MVDIARLLREETLVRCTLDHDAPNLAWLDPDANPNRELPSNSQLELPLWLADNLKSNHHVTIAQPDFYAESARRSMRADAPDMDLRRWNEYYFEVGMRMAELTDDEGLGAILLRGFVNRYRNLLGPALNATTAMDMRSRKAKLTQMERSLFDLGLRAKREYDDWRILKRSQVEASRYLEGNRPGQRRRLQPV